ncbi:hypothetical protein CWC28_08510 [Pseudoalteromonas sp. S4492]|nr:hypothetical protein CWC28_08510 [Pseudoalteromonas sp. S4492]
MGSFARHHGKIRECFVEFRGSELTTKEIKSIIKLKMPSFDERWIHPSDHCINHTCIGACECAKTDSAIFERIKRGLYKVI